MTARSNCIFRRSTAPRPITAWPIDLDGERIGDVYGRLTAGNFAFTAAFGRRLKFVPTASFGTIFNEQVSPSAPRTGTSPSRASTAATFGGTRLALDAGFDRSDYEGVYPFASDSDAYRVLLNQDASQGIRWNAGIRLSRALPGRQTLTAGGIFYDNVRQNQWYWYSDPAFESGDLFHSSRQGGAYIQDEIHVRPWLLLNGGVRYDQYENFGRATPRGAVIVSPRSGTSFKYLYGQAFRAPNAYELYYYGTTPEDLQPEFVRTHEVVWEQYVGEWLRTSASAYHYAVSQLITFHSIDSDTFQGQFGFVNDGVIHANGLELEAEVRTKRGLQAVMSYVRQDTKEAGADTPLTNSPRHMVKVRVAVPVGPRAFASAEWQLTGKRSTLAGDTVGAASVVHLAAGWPITRTLALTGSVGNLFDQRVRGPGIRRAPAGLNRADRADDACRLPMDDSGPLTKHAAQAAERSLRFGGGRRSGSRALKSEVSSLQSGPALECLVGSRPETSRTVAAS